MVASEDLDPAAESRYLQFPGSRPYWIYDHLVVGVEEGTPVAEESWHAARLIPTSGIGGADEQARRATSALLAGMPAVRQFGRSILGPLGAPSGTIETFIEVPFNLGERRVFPDGSIRVSRGKRVWTALVEVKTGTNPLEVDQLESYLDVAREHGFDALITVANQIPAIAGDRPRVGGQAEAQEGHPAPLLVDPSCSPRL